MKTQQKKTLIVNKSSQKEKYIYGLLQKHGSTEKNGQV